MRRKSVLVVAATAIVVTTLAAFGAIDALELPLRDAILRRLPEQPATSTIIVAIDEASLRELGAWPWSRTTLATITDRIVEAGARGIAFDVLLAEPRDDDAALATAMTRTTSIAVAVIDDEGNWLLPAPELREPTRDAHGSFELDRDGILRRLATTKQSRFTALPALAISAASLVTDMPIAIGRSIAPAFRTRPRAIPRISAAALLRDPRQAAALRTRIVFFGPTALALGDRVLTPTSSRGSPDPGVAVHAAATESLVRGEIIRSASPLFSGAIAAAIVALLLTLRRRWHGLALCLTVAATCVIVFVMGSYALPAATLTLLTIAGTILLQMRGVMALLRGRAEQSESRLRVHRETDAQAKRVLAHELRTPLASMRGLTQLLGRFELSDGERRRVTELLEAEAGKLESMVQGLLELEQLPLRDFDASTSPIDLAELVARRGEFLRAGSDRIRIEQPSSPAIVRADAALLERVIDNLVGNALKYTGEPVIVRTLVNGATAALEVEDRGEGIGDLDRRRIFDRFFRGASAAGTQGLGLGLSLVAEITRWHGGEITVERASGGGSLFRVRLPLASAQVREARR